MGEQYYKRFYKYQRTEQEVDPLPAAGYNKKTARSKREFGYGCFYLTEG